MTANSWQELAQSIVYSKFVVRGSQVAVKYKTIKWRPWDILSLEVYSSSIYLNSILRLGIQTTMQRACLTMQCWAVVNAKLSLNGLSHSFGISSKKLDYLKKYSLLHLFDILVFLMHPVISLLFHFSYND